MSNSSPRSPIEAKIYNIRDTLKRLSLNYDGDSSFGSLWQGDYVRQVHSDVGDSPPESPNVLKNSVAQFRSPGLIVSEETKPNAQNGLDLSISFESSICIYPDYHKQELLLQQIHAENRKNLESRENLLDQISCLKKAFSEIELKADTLEKEKNELWKENNDLFKYIKEIEADLKEMSAGEVQNQEMTHLKSENSFLKQNLETLRINNERIAQESDRECSNLKRKVEKLKQILHASNKENVIPPKQNKDNFKEFVHRLNELIIQSSPPNTYSRKLTLDQMYEWILRLIKEYLGIKSKHIPINCIMNRLKKALKCNSNHSVFLAIWKIFTENEKLLIVLSKARAKLNLSYKATIEDIDRALTIF